MKDRIKKFYEEHEEAILVGCVTSALYLGSALLLRKITSSQIRQVARGGVIENIEPLMRADGVQVILAHAKNGNTFRFEKNQ